MKRLSFCAWAAVCGALFTLAPDATAAGTIRVAANAEIRSTNPGVNRDANTDASGVARKRVTCQYFRQNRRFYAGGGRR